MKARAWGGCVCSACVPEEKLESVERAAQQPFLWSPTTSSWDLLSLLGPQTFEFGLTAALIHSFIFPMVMKIAYIWRAALNVCLWPQCQKQPSPHPRCHSLPLWCWGFKHSSAHFQSCLTLRTHDWYESNEKQSHSVCSLHYSKQISGWISLSILVQPPAYAIVLWAKGSKHTKTNVLSYKNPNRV